MRHRLDGKDRTLHKNCFTHKRTFADERCPGEAHSFPLFGDSFKVTHTYVCILVQF